MATDRELQALKAQVTLLRRAGGSSGPAGPAGPAGPTGPTGTTITSALVTLNAQGFGTVNDANVTALSLVVIGTGSTLNTDVNDPEMDAVVWNAHSVAAGSFVAYGQSRDQISGPFRINYTRSN